MSSARRLPPRPPSWKTSSTSEPTVISLPSETVAASRKKREVFSNQPMEVAFGRARNLRPQSVFSLLRTGNLVLALAPDWNNRLYHRTCTDSHRIGDEVRPVECGSENKAAEGRRANGIDPRCVIKLRDFNQCRETICQ